MRQLLMLFAKIPEHGKVKTRLAATIGEDKALKIYLKLLQHSHEMAAKVDGVDKIVFYTSDPMAFDLLDYYRIPKTTQSQGDLGEKMSDAFKRGFAQGYDQVIIIGTDCIDLNQEHLNKAFDCLRDHDFVIGPAEDGGYYLLGMNSHHPLLFQNKRWSTSDVFLDTILDIKSLKKSYAILDTLSDVDREEDLTEELLELIAE